MLQKKVTQNSFYNIDKKLEIKDIKKYFYRYLDRPNQNNLFTTCWAKLYKTKLLSNKNLYFNEDLRLCEDTDFVFRFLKISKNIQYINHSIYRHSLGSGKQNLKKATFGVNLELDHQISFLVALEACKNYLIKNDENLSKVDNKLDQCIGAYTVIYTIRSCIQINSLYSLNKTYLFWKDFYKRKLILNAINNYSYKKSGGSWILPFLIKRRLYFLAVLIAYFFAKKRYL